MLATGIQTQNTGRSHVTQGAANLNVTGARDRRDSPGRRIMIMMSRSLPEPVTVAEQLELELEEAASEPRRTASGTQRRPGRGGSGPPAQVASLSEPKIKGLGKLT
jgi:hypothetical protein